MGIETTDNMELRSIISGTEREKEIVFHDLSQYKIEGDRFQTKKKSYSFRLYI